MVVLVIRPQTRVNSREGDHLDCALDSNQISNLDHTLLTEDIRLRSCQVHHPLRTCSGGTSVPAAAPPLLPILVPQPTSSASLRHFPDAALQNADSIHLLIPLKAHQVCSTFLIHQLMSKLGFDASACAKLLLNPSTYVFGAIGIGILFCPILFRVTIVYNLAIHLLSLFYYFPFGVSKVSTVYQNSKLRMSLTLTYHPNDSHSVKWFSTVRSHGW